MNDHAPRRFSPAHMHRLGLGMPHADMRRALELYQKAATLGDPKAKLVLAGIHAQGVVIDDVQDPTRKFILLSPNIHRAFDLWHEAASVAQQPAALTDANPTSFIADPETASQSLVCLGNCYFLGVGLPETRPAMREVDAFDVKPDVEVTGVPQPLAYGRPSYHVALKFWEMAAEADPANLQAWLHIGNV